MFRNARGRFVCKIHFMLQYRYRSFFFPFSNNDETIYLSQYQITKTITTFVFHNIVK